jgi:putative glutamine amidotransferase
MRPLIGITPDTISYDSPSQRLMKYGQSHSYSDAISEAGGIPVILPISKNIERTRETFNCLDAVLFAGGNDVHPRWYGQSIRHARNFDAARDRFEMDLMSLSLSNKKPVLGICRGMQLLNVHRGGTLHQDILSEVPGANNHNGYIREPGVDLLTHEITIEQHSQLGRILGVTALQANTYHHQAVNKIGSELRVSAHADDGLIEAIEMPDEEFVIGVQPHPESFRLVEPRWRRLFSAFVLAASAHH